MRSEFNISGVLPAAIAANAKHFGLICPASCGSEAAWAGDSLEVIAPENIIQLVNHFKGNQVLSQPIPTKLDINYKLPDMQDIKVQESAKRAIEIAAAGGHNLLMVGPPGSGKSMLAQRLPSILPSMDAKEILETIVIASIAEQITDGKIGQNRPFRDPHHSASTAAMVGGGIKAKPGEMSLAHNGVLFLDELPEFSPKVLESLRQPLETRKTVIARANNHVTYPANFQLIAAMNPCRCGRAGEPGYTCLRGSKCITDYQAKLSGPLLDRIDIIIDVPAVQLSDLTLPPAKENSKTIARRIKKARDIQKKRFLNNKITNININSRADGLILEKIANLSKDSISLIKEANEVMQFSARGYHRILRLARTIADINEHKDILKEHIAEAVLYRRKLDEIYPVNKSK